MTNMRTEFGRRLVFSAPLFCVSIIIATLVAPCWCASMSTWRFGYPETRGVTNVGDAKISCGRRFFSSSRSSLTAQIVGGRDAEPGEMPFIVSITHSAKNIHFCGGSLIGPQHILTAAHCLQRQRTNLKVKVREYNIFRTETPPAEEFGVETYAMHPEWNPATLRNDLAIITLDRPVNMDNFAQPICLPSSPASSHPLGVDFMVGQNLTVAGWGATREGGKMSPILQKVLVPVIDYTTCKNKLFPQFFITETHLCAGYRAGGKDSCQGDSGGPLFKEEEGYMTLEGIVSAGIGCARVGMPGVYTRVSEYVPWITASMAAHQQAEAQATGHSTFPAQPEIQLHTPKRHPEVEAFFGDGATFSTPSNNWISQFLNLFG